MSLDSAVTEPSEQVGLTYTLVLPSGWTQLPLGDGADARVAELVDLAFATTPDGASPDQVATLRRQVEGQLRAAVVSARDDGGVDLYLPTGPVRGLPVPASFVVGQLSSRDEVPDAARLVAALVVDDPTARAVELGPHLAVRTERASPPATAPPAPPSRGIDYFIPTPDGHGWATVAFSTLVVEDEGEDVTPLLVDLFDAVMTTFRWA